MVLLVDERPEEVTEMQRTVRGRSSPPPSTNRPPAIAWPRWIERAKRLVELKKDVVIMLDSITRLARAQQRCPPGKVLTGVDANALQRPKRFFGAARKVEEGGCLTIIATALVDTGSRIRGSSRSSRAPATARSTSTAACTARLPLHPTQPQRTARRNCCCSRDPAEDPILRRFMYNMDEIEP